MKKNILGNESNRKTVLDHISNYQENNSYLWRWAEYFDEIRGAWIVDETLSSVWYIFSNKTKTKTYTKYGN